MSPERIGRKQELVDFVAGEIDAFNKGDKGRLSSNQELHSMFGYSPDTISQYLSESGLVKERKVARKKRKIFRISPRQEKLLTAVEEEISRYKNGDISRISSSSELASIFIYSCSRVPTIIKNLSPELSRERVEIVRLQRKEGKLLLNPSVDLAWILGVMVSMGKMDRSRSFYLVTRNQDLLEAFKLASEAIFKVSGKELIRSRWGFDDRGVAFYSTVATRAIGKFRKSEWSRFVMEKHSWILENSSYIWGFLGGLFDTKGYIYRKHNNDRRVVVRFSIRDEENLNFITELLARVGVRYPTIPGRGGISIQSLSDIQLLALNIYSKLREKQDKLEAQRNFFPPPRNWRRPQEVYRDVSSESAIEEWRRLTRLLGHTPTWGEITRLKSQGKAKYSTQVYETKFGDGSFARAKNVLEKIIPIQDIEALLKDYAEKTGREVKYTPKLHITNDQRQQEEQAKKKLEEILERSELSQVPSLLVAPDGKPIASPQERLEPGPSIIESIPRLGKTGRKILNALLASSQKPILSSELVKIVYGSDVDLETGRQRIRMMIYKVLNPALKKLGFSIVNTAQSKTATEALYQLRKIDSMVELSDIKQGVKPVKRYENLVRWSEEDEVFKIELPDKKILKTDSEFKARFVAKFVQNKTASMVELCNDFYGEYNHRNADNITHMVLRANRLLESIGWRIVQLTHPRDFRLGQKAVYSLEEIRQQAVA